MNIDPSTTKYLIHARLDADGVVEKPDVIGAIFGQTEGLLGEELDLRDLQKSGRIGRIEVEVSAKKGKSEGIVYIPSSLDQIETSVLASSLETIDRVGPCKATIKVEKVEDVRITKRNKIVDRARQLLTQMLDSSKVSGMDLLDEVRKSIQISEITTYGPDRVPAGPNISDSDAIIVVEGRSDVLNLLKCGIKNSIAVEGTNVPKSVMELSKERVVTAFVDGDRGGDLILKELLQVAEIDFIARAPRGTEVEEMTQKQIMKALRNKMPTEQYVEMYGLGGIALKTPDEEKPLPPPPRQEEPRPEPRYEHYRQEPRPEPSMEASPREQTPSPKETPRRASPQAPPQPDKYREMLSELAGTSKARILDEKDEIAVEVPVRELVETLKGNTKKVKAVVFDGIITQRILDIASDLGIKSVVGAKMGTVTKQPAGVQILTRSDLSS